VIEMAAGIKQANPVRSLSARYAILFSGLMVLLLFLFLLDLFLGSVSLSPREVIQVFLDDTEGIARTILMKFRLPKALTAVIAGIALSVSGLQMQTLFRNPMAGPYVLGLSSGASLGVAFIILGFTSDISPDALTSVGNWAIAGAAWIGAGLVMLLVMVISSKVKNIMTVLILGIMLSAGVSALVSIMQYFSSETMLKAYVIWTMGSLGNLTASQLNVMLISVAAGIAVSLLSVKMLNALLLGEDYAKSIGLSISHARIIVIAGTSILAGTVTAFCGPIGFIGIAVPHITRLIFRTSDHRVLLPATIITGAAIMLASDIISQVPGSDSVLPVNSVTALIGIPIVIWVILQNQKNLDIF
jgi:iron complex transport system permease protein